MVHLCQIYNIPIQKKHSNFVPYSYATFAALFTLTFRHAINLRSHHNLRIVKLEILDDHRISPLEAFYIQGFDNRRCQVIMLDR